MAPVIGFRVRILNPDGSPLTPGVDNADDAWESWRGGGEQTIKDCKPGKDTFKADTRAGDLVLRGPVTSGRKDMLTWYQDMVTKSKTYRRMLTITELSDDGTGTVTEGKKYVYHDCFPCRYVFPRMSVTNTTGNVMEEVTIRPIRVEIK
jgi:hypothetical protein